MKKLNNLEKTVSVIIPTFNRAKFLPITIPTYYQECVKEIIIINDCSTDNTLEVLDDLQKQIPILNVVNASKKLKQTGAKNLGIEAATGEYLFFGDDDSIISSNAIYNLLSNYNKYGGCISSLLHAYMTEDTSIETVVKNFRNSTNVRDDVFNSNTMKLNLTRKWNMDIELPFCSAHFLVNSDDIGDKRFNENFKGTCFREETDFILDIKQSTHFNIFIDFNSWVINLPRQGDSGGTQSYGFFTRKISEVYNEFIFFRDHGKYLSSYVNFSSNPFIRSLMHVVNSFLKK